MKAKRTWILVADGARAQILENQGPGTGLVAALDHDFAAPHGANSALGTERPGKGSGAAGGTGHAVGPKVDWHEFAKERFARDVAAVLDKAAAAGAFDRLVLVAPPKTLGALRKELKADTRARVTEEVNKDLTHLDAGAIVQHLSAVMIL